MLESFNFKCVTERFIAVSACSSLHEIIGVSVVLFVCSSTQETFILLHSLFMLCKKVSIYAVCFIYIHAHKKKMLLFFLCVKRKREYFKFRLRGETFLKMAHELVEK